MKKQSAELKLETAALGGEEDFPVMKEGETHSHRPEQIRRAGDVVHLQLAGILKCVGAARMDNRHAARIHVGAFRLEKLNGGSGNDQDDFDAAVTVFVHIASQDMMGHIEQDVVHPVPGCVNGHFASPCRKGSFW